MRKYEDKVIEAGTDFSANPSPGNIKDGLITDANEISWSCKKRRLF